jgi:hypothetical protein
MNKIQTTILGRGQRLRPSDDKLIRQNAVSMTFEHVSYDDGLSEIIVRLIDNQGRAWYPEGTDGQIFRLSDVGACRAFAHRFGFTFNGVLLPD